MSEQINIRFSGNADFSQARREVKELNHDLNRLQSTLVANAKANAKLNGNTQVNAYRAQVGALNEMRHALVDNMSALGEYRVRQGQVLSQQDQWAKKIREGKATFGDLFRNHKMFNSVLKDQIALQRSLGMAWTQSQRTGKFNVTSFIPESLPQQLRTARAELGLFSNMVNVASDNMVKWGKNTQWAGRQLMVGFTVPMGIAAAATGKMAFDLDKSLTQVVKVYGDANAQFQESTDSIRNSAMSTARAAAQIYGESAKDTLSIMADLAASGKSGLELQQATLNTVRASVLGELEWQDAVKATISLQEVYHHNAQQIGDDFNYINAMENQTVLTAQDFVTAIPKVSGVMNELGGDLKDTGSLLTAFKAAGIDAAEGANALKSINFRLVATYGKGLETFNAMTGRDLRQIINETNGETIPSLMRFADAIKNLSAPQKIAVTRDVFGIYQGSKALMLLEQMTEKTEQWQNAMDVANNTNIENAAIAQQEIDRQSERPFRKLEIAVESLKINLAEAGEAFLGPAASIVTAASNIVDWFNKLGSGAKMAFAILATGVALAGPLVMLAGLFMNLVGNVMKMVSKVGMLATGFKMLSVEEKMAEIAARNLDNVWDTQAQSAGALALQVQHLNNALREQQLLAVDADQRVGTAEHRAKYQTAAPSGVSQNAAGAWVWNSNGRVASAANQAKFNEAKMRNEGYNERVTMSPARMEAAYRLNNMITEAADAQERLAEKSAESEKRLRKFAQAAGTASLFAGMLATSINGPVGTALEVVGLFGMVAPGLMGKGLSKMAGMFGGFTAKMKGGLVATKNYAMDLIGSMGKMGPVLGIAALAGVAAYKLIGNAIEEARQKAEDFGKTGETFASILQFSYQQAPQLNTEDVKDGARATEILAEKFREENANAAEILGGRSGATTGEKWATAIAKGLDVKLHGGTTQAAKDATRVALKLMDESFTDKEFEMEINARINFDDAKSRLAANAQEISMVIADAIADEGDGAEAFARWFNGSDDLTGRSSQMVKDLSKNLWGNVMVMPADQRKAAFQTLQQQTDKDLKELYDRLRKTNGQYLDSIGVFNTHDLAKRIQEGKTGFVENGILSDEEMSQYQKRADALMALARQVATLAGVTKEEDLNKIYTLMDLFQHRQVTGNFGDAETPIRSTTEAMADYDAAIASAAKNGRTLTYEEKLAMLNRARVSAGLAEAGTVAQYFGDAAASAASQMEDFNAQLVKMGMNPEVTFDSVSSSWKNVMTAVSGSMFDVAADLYKESADAAMDALKEKGDNALDAIEARAEASDKKFEKMEDAQRARHEALKKAFDKRWDARKKTEEAAFDARIEQIEKQIEAEKKAEDERQKIFEAEKLRIQRLAEMYNTNIDINMAINSGNLDEAAKLQSNAAATQAQWIIDDAAVDGKSALDARVGVLEAQKEAIQKAKDARMEALDAIKEREKELLDSRIENEQKALKVAQDAAKARFEAEKEAQQKINANREAALKADQARKQREMEIRLSIERAFVPRNEEELKRQQARIEEIYNDYGFKLTTKGKQWSNVIGTSLKNEVAREGNAIATTVNWSKVGSDISGAMLKGALGMTKEQFAAWINGGVAPAGSFMAAPSGRTRSSTYGGRLNDPNSGALHKGGAVGAHNDYSRRGWSGPTSPGEVNIRALVGEGMVNRAGMRLIGKSGLDYINSGGSRGGMGGGGVLGLGSVPGVYGAAFGMGLIESSYAGAINKKMGKTGTYFGNKINIPEAYDVPYTSGDQKVLASGRVVYLGHGSYRGGFNPGPVVRPTSGKVTSLFGPRSLLGMNFHNGIDIANASGTPIKSATNARVIYSGWDNTGYGNYTMTQSSDGTIFGYGHQSSIGVRAGQRVVAGQVMGRMGSTGKSTGPHLHFQIGRDGKWFNPRSVMPQLSRGGLTVSDGIAKLHNEEAVLTKPLTQEFTRGVQNFANGGSNEYTVNIEFKGPVNTELDIEKVVTRAIEKAEKKKGSGRRI